MDIAPPNRIGLLDPELLRDQLAMEYADRLARRDELLMGINRFQSATSQGISDEDTQAKATDFVKQIKSEIKFVDTLRESTKRPFLESGKVVDGFFKARIIDTLKAGVDVIETKMTAFARKKAEESRKAAAEAARLAKEEADRLAGEALFDAAAAPDAAAAETQAAEAAQLAAANAATHSRVHGDLGGVASLRTRWVFEVVNTNAVPLRYLMPNEAEIRAAVASGVRDIPGVRIYQEEKVVVR